MTPEARTRLLWWLRTAVMVVAFAGMLWALSGIVRRYRFAQITAAIGSLPARVVVVAALVQVVQYALLTVREWLAVRYARRPELGLARIALVAVVSRSLMTLGIASITNLGLRLRMYGRWGLDTADVVRVMAYTQLTYAAGEAAQIALVLGLLPVPAAVASEVSVTALRVIGAGAAVVVVAYVAWCVRRREDLHVRSFVVPIPRRGALVGSIVLPVLDKLLGAAILLLCLPRGLDLGYLDVVTITFLAAIATWATQIPAGLGVLESTLLLFVPDPAAAPTAIAGLLVFRVLTNLLPMAVGGILFVGSELSRRPGRALIQP